MRISDRHGNGLVSHQFLNCAEIDSSHNQPTGKSVSDVVIPEVENARFLHCCLERSPWVFIARSLCSGDYISASISLPLKDLQSNLRSAVDRDVPTFSVLATRDRNNHQSTIYVFPTKPILLPAPHSCVQSKIKLRFQAAIVFSKDTA